MPNYTELHEAARDGKEELVKLLLDNGAKIEAKGIGNFTALHAAASNGHKEVVELLLDRGADIHAKDWVNYTALHIAVLNGDHKELVKLLLDRGADIDAKNNWHSTALHAAASKGNKELVKLLLDRGADIDAKDNDEETALDIAREEGNKEIVELITQHPKRYKERIKSGLAFKNILHKKILKEEVPTEISKKILSFLQDKTIYKYVKKLNEIPSEKKLDEMYKNRHKPKGKKQGKPNKK